MTNTLDLLKALRALPDEEQQAFYKLAKKKQPRGAQHTMESAEHGSPPAFVDLARRTMGGIDLDPMSSERWNRRVGAKRFITKEQSAFRTPWTDGAPIVLELRTNPVRGFGERLRVFLNPAGDKSGDVVAQAWFGLTTLYVREWVSSAIWVGFNVEQLARLQRVGAPTHPLAEMTLVPPERTDYIDELTDRAQKDAPHASFVTLLSRDPRERERFAGLAGQLGHVVNGDRR